MRAVRGGWASGAVLALALPLLAGCGGPDYDADPNDKRAVALECLTETKDLSARLDGEDAIVVGDAETGPRIRFFLTSGEAEAEQFAGRGEGAEQIGNALLFVRDGSEEDLAEIENCLDEL
jgi:hypothetical protein